MRSAKTRTTTTKQKSRLKQRQTSHMVLLAAEHWLVGCDKINIASNTARWISLRARANMVKKDPSLRLLVYDNVDSTQSLCSDVWHLNTNSEWLSTLSKTNNLELAFFFTILARARNRVGSANFSQRKIGHAHDNSADSENVAGAPQPNVHAHFIFRFENGPGN